MTAKELREKRARLITNARSKHSEITEKTTEARAAEIETEFEQMISEAEALEARAVTLERLERAEASLGDGDPRRPQGNDGQRSGDPEPQLMEYRQAFHAFLMAEGNEAMMEPEARAALRRGQAEFSAEQRAQIAGDAAKGGHLVPDEMHAPLIRAMAAWGPMFDDATTTVLKTTGGGSLPLPGVDDTDKTADKSGPEGQALADTGNKDVIFTKETLEDYMYDTEWLRVSIQLATSGMVNMEQLLSDLLGERLGRRANRALTLGTGTGEPLGIVTGAAAGVNAAAAAALATDEILDLYHSVDPAYRASPKFGAMFNDNTLGALHKLKDADGRYLVQEAPDGAGKLRIGAVTMRYKINQAMADIGAGNRSMIAGDLGRYYTRKIGGVVVGAMQGKEFWPGYGVAGYARLDGTVADQKAIKALVHPGA